MILQGMMMFQNNRYSLDRITVLIIDDTPTNRKVAAYALSDCIVLEAANGDQGVEILRSHPDIDVILLDVMMPGMSGYEVCLQIKAHPRWRLIPVVMLTSLEGVDSRVNALRAGADDFISRPCDIAELQARVYNSARVKRYTEQLEDTENILFTLANMVESKDPYTNGHLQRIEKQTETFCRRLGLSEALQKTVRYGGLLHDIGKVAVSDKILCKPSRLTPDEFEAMKIHTITGYNIIASLRMGNQVGPIIRGHHERWDGNGYPDRLKETNIPLGARIIKICDVFDALTTNRSYREKVSAQEALAYIQNQSGNHFDPDLVRVFSQLIQDYH
jgi:putative two-component system response regulator